MRTKSGSSRGSVETEDCFGALVRGFVLGGVFASDSLLAHQFRGELSEALLDRSSTSRAGNSAIEFDWPLNDVLIVLVQESELIAGMVARNVEDLKVTMTGPLSARVLVALTIQKINLLLNGTSHVSKYYSGLWLVEHGPLKERMVHKTPLPPPFQVRGVFVPNDGTIRNESFNQVLASVNGKIAIKLASTLLVAHRAGWRLVPAHRLFKAAHRDLLPVTAPASRWRAIYESDKQLRNRLASRIKPVREAFDKVGFSLNSQQVADEYGRPLYVYSLVE